MKKKTVSTAVIRRMPRYYRHLQALKRKGIFRISSEGLATRTGLTSSQIRQDLASFGGFGQQGYGYNVTELSEEIAEILGMTCEYSMVLLGVGRLGKALLANAPFEEYGVRVVAAYDVDPSIVGTNFMGFPVRHADQLERDLLENPVDIGVLTAATDAAQKLTEIMEKNGAKGIWNFTNLELRTKNKDLVVENVHFFDSFFSLCCMMKGKDSANASNY